MTCTSPHVQQEVLEKPEEHCARNIAASADWSVGKGKVAVVLVCSLIGTPWPCNTRHTQTLVFCHSPEHSLRSSLAIDQGQGGHLWLHNL